MVLAALDDPDPVFIFEHATLYPLEADVDEEARPVDISHAVVRRQGGDVTLVTHGGSLGKCLAAADELGGDGIEAEVVDLRTLRPLDMDTVLASLAKTHRMVIVDEGWRTGSLAGEISAQVMEFGALTCSTGPSSACAAPRARSDAKHLEDAALPSAERVVAVVREMRI